MRLACTLEAGHVNSSLPGDKITYQSHLWLFDHLYCFHGISILPPSHIKQNTFVKAKSMTKTI